MISRLLLFLLPPFPDKDDSGWKEERRRRSRNFSPGRTHLLLSHIMRASAFFFFLVFSSLPNSVGNRSWDKEEEELKGPSLPAETEVMPFSFFLLSKGGGRTGEAVCREEITRLFFEALSINPGFKKERCLDVPSLLSSWANKRLISFCLS